MKTYTITVIEMSIEELTKRFKKFIKETTKYEGDVRVAFDNDDKNNIIVEVDMDLTNEQGDLLLEAGVCPMIPPATGLDLLYQIYGEYASFSFSSDSIADIKIIIKN